MPTTKSAELPYWDLLDVSEIYSDCIRLTHFDGHSVRIEFAVVRAAIAERNQVGPTVFPAARLVLSPPAAVALHSQLQLLIAGMEGAGAVKRIVPTAPTKQ